MILEKEMPQKRIEPILAKYDDFTAQEWMKAYHRACAKNLDVRPKFSWIVRELKREV